MPEQVSDSFSADREREAETGPDEVLSVRFFLKFLSHTNTCIIPIKKSVKY